MTTVVVDTNILVDSPYLRKRGWESLVDHAEAWGVRIVVPQVVFMETVNVVGRRWMEERDLLMSVKLGEFSVAEQISVIVTEIESRAEGYAAWLSEYLDEHGISIEPVPPVDHMEIARRASSGRNPFTRGKDGKTKDGYRDTLIWLTLLAIARANPNEEVWLVSHNTRDFGSSQENRKSSDADGREGHPGQQFHHEFAEELVEHGLDERVRYAISIERLEGHLAAQFAPITGEELQERIDAIAMDKLAAALVAALIGAEVDPESAALPVEMVGAVIVGAREPLEGWEFGDAAGRGNAGWTARFLVDTEVDLTLVGAPIVGAEHTKPLRATGQAIVAPDGQVVDVTVDSIEALPDDPMRARWVRRAERPLIDAARLSKINEALNARQDEWNKIIRASTQLSGVTEALKAQQEAQAKLIRDAVTPSLTDALRAQYKDWSERMRAVPGLAESLKAQQDQWAKTIRDATSGVAGLKDTLDAQQNQWAKTIRDATSGVAGLKDILDAQQAEWAKTIRDATSGFTGFAKGPGSGESGGETDGNDNVESEDGIDPE